jgi:hypothetical protein
MDLKTLFSKSSAEKSQLGLFWGKDSFSISETVKGLPDKVANIRFDAPVPGDQGQKIPDTLRFTALLQQAIRDKKIISKKVNISLSAKDVIYRSFVIPFMQPNEVKNVVDFEATKYIPIKLEELAYTYYAVPFTEGQQKSLRILFVAARKSILERYTSILQQSGLETEFMEPSSVSLMRVLQKQALVPRLQSTAVIEVEGEGGRITIVDKDIIQFVREFQSPVEGVGIPSENAKFFNDIRVSFNFYQRQNSQAKLDRILIIASSDLTALASGLGQEFKVPATAVTVQKILKDQPGDLGLLNASGISIRERISSSKNFDLSIKSARPGKGIGEPAGALADWNFKTLALSLGFSAALIFGTSFLTKNLTADAKRNSERLTLQLGMYKSSEKTKITELKDEVIAKLNQYKDIRVKSDITYYLKKVPMLLPNGAWLSTYTIDYSDVTQTDAAGSRVVNKPVLGMDGYIYLPNPNDQIRQVNVLVTKLKTDEKFSKLFSEIVLTNVRQETLNNYPVTYFRITCK